MKAIINNLEFPKDKADAQIAPSIYNMPLEKAVEGAPKGKLPKELDPKKDEILTIDNKQYILANMTPDEINGIILKWKSTEFDRIRDTKGPIGWVASIVEPYCKIRGDGSIDLGALGETSHQLIYDRSSNDIRAMLLCSKNLKIWPMPSSVFKEYNGVTLYLLLL